MQSMTHDQAAAPALPAQPTMRGSAPLPVDDAGLLAGATVRELGEVSAFSVRNAGGGMVAVLLRSQAGPEAAALVMSPASFRQLAGAGHRIIGDMDPEELRASRVPLRPAFVRPEASPSGGALAPVERPRGLGARLSLWAWRWRQAWRVLRG